VNWSILSDCNLNYRIPSNVHIIKYSFDEVQNIIYNAFDFVPVIDSYHKLCEYKPAYGYLFPELIKGFDYWGYGDIDLIYGDIRSFLTEEVLSYDKIFQLGHFTLIKNEKKFNEMFMQPIMGELYYKKAFMSSANFNFDESFQNKYSINTIFEQQGCSIWKESYAADIYTKSNAFVLDLNSGICEKRKTAIFIWDNGKLVRYVKSKNSISSKDFLYIHLQKRIMAQKVNDKCRCYKIIPNEFAELEVPVEEIPLKFPIIKKRKINNQYFRIRFNNLLMKMTKKYSSA
jgi:hypothetical protein